MKRQGDQLINSGHENFEEFSGKKWEFFVFILSLQVSSFFCCSGPIDPQVSFPQSKGQN